VIIITIIMMMFFFAVMPILLTLHFEGVDARNTNIFFLLTLPIP
jgi:hypothetical protein